MFSSPKDENSENLLDLVEEVRNALNNGDGSIFFELKSVDRI